MAGPSISTPYAEHVYRAAERSSAGSTTSDHAAR
jgi:hypothetical protein